MGKQEQYLALVELFKKHKFCDDRLKNPHDLWHEKGLRYNCINPWSLWHGNLDAQILVIGQDWSGEDHFAKNFSDNWIAEIKNDTNKNLRELFRILGYDIGLPDPDMRSNFSNLPLFFTNAVLGIKSGVMGAKIENESWYNETAIYLLTLICIIQPKYIIALGGYAYNVVHSIYKDICKELLPKYDKTTVTELVANNGKHPIIGSSKLFVTFHTGSNGLINRKAPDQISDWKKIKEYMDKDNN